MKKLFILFGLFLCLFSFDVVSAQEISEEDNQKVQQLLDYAEQNNIMTDYIYILKNNTTYRLFIGSRDFYIVKSSFFKIYYDTSLGVLSTKIVTLNSEGEISSSSSSVMNGGNDIASSSQTILYSFCDIKDTSDNVIFTKNYPTEDTPTEPEVTPTPIPPSDVDVSELEKCDSFVCDIGNGILQDFNDSDYPFVNTIINYLVLLVFVFTLLAPFLVVYLLLRRCF